MLHLYETKKYIIDRIEKAHDEGKRIYICGGGSSARELYKKACQEDGRNIPLEAFLKNYKKVTGMDYTGEAWLWEAEKNNIKKLVENYSSDNQIHIVEKGAGKKKG